MPALACHARVSDVRDLGAVLRAAGAVLHDRFGIEHSTIQMEPADADLHAGMECPFGEASPARSPTTHEQANPCPPASKTTP
jgi:hypothetical protein